MGKLGFPGGVWAAEAGQGVADSVQYSKKARSCDVAMPYLMVEDEVGEGLRSGRVWPAGVRENRAAITCSHHSRGP